MTDASSSTVYRMYDADDRLLYIGRSDDAAKRVKHHARSKSWWHEVADVRFEHCVDRYEASEVEIAAIAVEHPVYNRMLSGILRRPAPRPPNVVTLGEIDPVGPIEIADRAGVKRATVDQWRQRDPTFPPPRWTVGGRPAWNWDDIGAWLTATGRRPLAEVER